MTTRQNKPGTRLVLVATVLAFACTEETTPSVDGGIGGTGGAVSKIASDDASDFMEVVVSSAPKAAYHRVTEGSYGANFYYLYEVLEDPATTGGFIYASNSNPVETSIVSKGWQVPDGALWSAGRLELDGLDPFSPSTDDWLIYPYLPFAKWKSTNEIVNDGQACPGLEGQDAYGRPKCIGKHQLDESAPNLQDDHLHLARMVMNTVVGGSRPIACYQRVFAYTRTLIVSSRDRDTALRS